MTDVCAIAVGAVSGLGLGEAAYACDAVGEPAQCALAHDEVLAQAGLTRPRAARAPRDLGVAPSADRATDLLRAALAQVCERLDATLPRWRERRLGVCIGTSSGGMIAAERFFAARARAELVSEEQARRATYFAPFVDALAHAGIRPHKSCQVLAACASSTIALGLALRWLERGACDLVLAGGYDGVSLFVAAGFEALRATSASLPQPFRQGRDGMLLGEGAAVIALVRDEDAPAPLFRVSGFGASADAVHITAPDRTGAGLVRAARAALDDAACPRERISLVSAHATATPFNDAAEAQALRELFDPVPLVHPFKAQIGHTLGAAGALELLAATHALEKGVAPAACGDAPLDPEASVPLLERAEPRALAATLKLSAAFGGVTAALVAQREPSQRVHRPRRRVGLRAAARVGDAPIDRALLAEALDMPRDKIARIDDLGQLALAAAAALAAEVGSLAGAGVVGGYALATLDTNETFHRRLLDKGPRWVDPRLFPATTPNAGAGQVAIALGLTGPNFAVCSGLASALEALAVAAELVAAGDAARMVVLAADDAGPAARHWVEIAAPGRPLARGAVALLLEPDDGREVVPDMPIDHSAGPIGHLALLDWLDGTRSPALT